MSAPIKNTCPDINRVIKWITAATNEAWEGENMTDMDDIKATFKEIQQQLSGIEYILEDLRDANSSLRDWGDNCEEKIDKLELKIEELENQLQDR